MPGRRTRQGSGAKSRCCSRFFSVPGHSIKSFKAILAGEYDYIPEQAFFNCGGIEDVLANYEKMKAKEQD